MRDRRPPIHIVASPAESGPPFPVDAIVLEDDTYHVLSAEPRARAVYGPLGALLSEASQIEPKAPGNVVVRRGSPLCFLAVVHDLDQEPTCREDWVIHALASVFNQAEHRKLESIALPFLGIEHGAVDEFRFTELLDLVIRDSGLEHLKSIWLILLGQISPTIFAPLDTHDFRLKP